MGGPTSASRPEQRPGPPACPVEWGLPLPLAQSAALGHLGHRTRSAGHGLGHRGSARGAPPSPTPTSRLKTLPLGSEGPRNTSCADLEGPKSPGRDGLAGPVGGPWRGRCSVRMGLQVSGGKETGGGGWVAWRLHSPASAFAVSGWTRRSGYTGKLYVVCLLPQFWKKSGGKKSCAGRCGPSGGREAGGGPESASPPVPGLPPAVSVKAA